MQIGFLGAGRVSQALVHYLLQTGHTVVLSNSHGPESLSALIDKLGPGTTAGTIEEAAQAPIVLLAVPWPQVSNVLSHLPAWENRILIDATNRILRAKSDFLLASPDNRASSELVADLAPGARVVKALNTLYMEHFESGPRLGPGRRVVFLSGDDSAKREVGALFSEFGFAVIDLGDLHTGGLMQQAGGPLAGLQLFQIV
jgi:predicted dinucleotide-binding enzyme